MKHLTKHLLILGLTPLAAWAILLYMPQRTLAPVAPYFATFGQKRPDFTIDHFTMSGEESAHTSTMTICAKRADIFQDERQIVCMDAWCTLFHNNNETGKLYALKGIIEEAQQAALLTDHVFGTWAGMNLSGTNFYGDLENKTIHTNEPITVTHDRFTLVASQARLRLTDNSLALTGGVHCTLNEGTILSPQLFQQDEPAPPR